VAFKPIGGKIAFQDACRQSRFNGQAELPRKLLARLTNGTPLVDNGAPSVCCGNSAWTGCDAFSKRMQVQHIERAKQAGGEMIVTACPKCRIHLGCAMEDVMRGEALKMEMMDLTSAIARSIYWE
jgi:Fe-S oxidoreductase